MRAGGGCVRAGEGNRLKYLKRGWNRKEGRGNKYLKGGGQAGSRGGYLKRGGAGTPLNYVRKDLCLKMDKWPH